MSIDIPTRQDLAELTQHRSDASVTVYLSAAEWGFRAVAHATEAAHLALRTAVSESLAELGEGLSREDRERLTAHVRELEQDRDFWGTGARSIAVFASPEGLCAFRLMNELAPGRYTGDRFDVGPMIRAVTFEHTGYVLALTEGDVRLLHLDSGATSRRVELTDLPEDASEALTRAPQEGRFDRHRADGTLGPKPEQKRYASLVQKAVLEAIRDPEAPLLLAAANGLDPVYRDVNSHDRLLGESIAVNPASLSDEDLEARAREILDRHYGQRISDWVEHFGNQRAAGRASSQLTDVARAAREGRVAELLFDIEADHEGMIDEYGAVALADEPGPATYRVVDEVAAQVLRTGGRVRGVRAAEMPDEGWTAAVFRG
ncbi:hypothetical protein [Brevibacterium album]|uniref:baeRF11 domain-containing protein n=1 Tax=Brevibacterium album TaxID=417948 RepID=UPI000403B25A|nr:hypothetical protein [Brevibacterium album]